MISSNAPDPKRRKPLKHRIRLADVLVYAWLIVLSFTILVSAQSAYRQSLNTEEYPYACDSFGYLRMAKEIRRAAYRRKCPHIRLGALPKPLIINISPTQTNRYPPEAAVVEPPRQHYLHTTRRV